ncbi:MAG: ATP-dependent Clp protease ATP-binding subunit [Clostridia bacterium]|nr:ATP-dependent Clp protease ATP-binding subunit [Clostridia bacterium]
MKYAYELSNTYRTRYFSIEHIVYGYMKYVDDARCESSLSVKFPWYTDSSTYLSMLCVKDLKKRKSKEKHPIISDETFQLANMYKQFQDKMDIETFYYLIIHMNINVWEMRFIVPLGSWEPNNIKSKTFTQFLNSQKAHVYLNGSNPKQSVTKSPTKKASLPSANNTEPTVPFKAPLQIDKMADITNLAYKKGFPKIVGRDYELERLINILTKMNKNNAVLIGEAGVGKTSIVQALAQKIVANDVPDTLKNYHILELDATSIVAGTKYRGDFEKRVQDLLAKITKSTEKIILYIDEIHSSVGLGAAGDDSSLSFTDMLKPLLTNGSNIKIIGTSTFKDYKRFEADKVLERRFDTIIVNQPSFEQTVEILNSTKRKFEKYYKVEIPQSTLEATTLLSQRYIPERCLPEKAIDVLDETCAIKINSQSSDNIVSSSDVLVCISRKKGIPLNKVQKAYTLENLEQHLSSRVIGQPDVIKVLSQSIRRAQAGLNDENKPIASFMFIGPTGVGKTEIAKTLADIMFDNTDSLIRLDMSEYMEEHSISKLIGSPPGYVGYEDAGFLTEKVRRHPYSLVLFDEFEKAHPKICNALLQILDEGCLTDSHGDCINFKNTVIILTSNVGVNQLSQKTIGFGEQSSSKLRDILSEVKRKFPPEFLNRLDEIIQFNQLTKADIFKIANICISTDIQPKLKSKNICIDISDEVIEKVASLGYSQEYGARELKRTIVRTLKNPLADFILQNSEVHDIAITLVDGEITIVAKE